MKPGILIALAAVVVGVVLVFTSKGGGAILTSPTGGVPNVASTVKASTAASPSLLSLLLPGITQAPSVIAKAATPTSAPGASTSATPAPNNVAVTDVPIDASDVTSYGGTASSLSQYQNLPVTGTISSPSTVSSNQTAAQIAADETDPYAVPLVSASFTDSLVEPDVTVPGIIDPSTLSVEDSSDEIDSDLYDLSGIGLA